MKDGAGTLVSTNGAKFVGKFKQDKKHGAGKMHFPDNQRFEEQWQFGVLIAHKKIEEDQNIKTTDPLNNNSNKTKFSGA